jgi:site-specific recombinase XerD
MGINAYSASHNGVLRSRCMNKHTTSAMTRLAQLKDHLVVNRYAPSMQRRYVWLSRRFMEFLEARELPIEGVRDPFMDEFVRWELPKWKVRLGRAPRDVLAWRARYQTAIHMLLRVVHRRWPIQPEPTTALEWFHRGIVNGYANWMRELRGLSEVTCSARVVQALGFLTFLGSGGTSANITRLSVRQIDAYVLLRSQGKRRATIESDLVALRSFLRYLHGSGRICQDLSSCVIGPRVYDKEQIPSALPQESVNRILEVTHRDTSPTGIRDYALLTLLATYGLRAGEVVALRLDDIDWKREVLHLRHSKTGSYSELPLLSEPGEAVLRYLEKVRPKSEYREVFLKLCAPYSPYISGSVLNCVIGARLKEAGIVHVGGKRGPHALRHARAASLLHAAIPLKIIGDVLGHKSADSTAVYLKLATDPLRAVGLDIPRRVSP